MRHIATTKNKHDNVIIFLMFGGKGKEFLAKLIVQLSPRELISRKMT